MIRVEFTCATPELTLQNILQAKIQLFHVIRKNDLTYRVSVRRTEYNLLVQLLQRCGASVKIVGKIGLCWKMGALLHRPVLVAAFLILMISAFLLPGRILFISVDGNNGIPDRQILSAAEDCGIRFGASRKLVRSEKVKNALLAAVPQLQWAGVNTSGCTAVISVRERLPEENPKEYHGVSNMTAIRDGYILSATVTSGTGHCMPGEAVKEGQLLISGYTDCGICIRASRAEGEIFAQTKRNLSAATPQNIHSIQESADRLSQISLLIGKKRINLWKDSRISHGSCGRMYEEYYVSLPGGFRLPLAVCVDRQQTYQLEETTVSENDAKRQLQQFSRDYLLRQMVAGQILNKQQTFSAAEGLYWLESQYTCAEMIGKEQRE
jgi:sporulation protein YqfD